MTTWGRVGRGSVNVRALVALALLAVWAVVLLSSGAFTDQRPPSQFDHDDGMLPPTEADRTASALQGIALIGALPVSAVALWLSMSSLRSWKGQVSAVVAASCSSLATLVSILLAWIGVGTLVFFA